MIPAMLQASFANNFCNNMHLRQGSAQGQERTSRDVRVTISGIGELVNTFV